MSAVDEAVCVCVMHADCDEEDSCWNMCHRKEES
jgi:hypothetical protein